MPEGRRGDGAAPGGGSAGAAGAHGLIHLFAIPVAPWFCGTARHAEFANLLAKRISQPFHSGSTWLVIVRYARRNENFVLVSGEAASTADAILTPDFLDSHIP